MGMFVENITRPLMVQMALMKRKQNDLMRGEYKIAVEEELGLLCGAYGRRFYDRKSCRNRNTKFMNDGYGSECELKVLNLEIQLNALKSQQKALKKIENTPNT